MSGDTDENSTVDRIECKRKTGYPLTVSDMLTCPPIPGLLGSDEIGVSRAFCGSTRARTK